MSSPASPQPAPASHWPPPVAVGEWCPLCGSALLGEQEWCLHCGAAARTRLAATPRWRAPVAFVAIVVLVSLAVLVASVVKLIG